MRKRTAQIDNQIDGSIAQKSALNTQLDLIEIELADHQKLFDRGLAQASRVLALQRTQAELSGNLGDLVAREADAAGPITEIEIEIQSQFTRRQEEVIRACAINNSAHWNWANAPKHYWTDWSVWPFAPLPLALFTD